jgi:hypothetical protein
LRELPRFQPKPSLHIAPPNEVVLQFHLGQAPIRLASKAADILVDESNHSLVRYGSFGSFISSALLAQARARRCSG